MWGFPRTNEPELMRVEVWVGVTLNEWRPMTWRGDDRKPYLRLMKPRVEDLASKDIKSHETQTPTTSPKPYIVLRG